MRRRGLGSRSIVRRCCRTEALGSLTRSEVLGALGRKRPVIWGWRVDAVVGRAALKPGIDFTPVRRYDWVLANALPVRLQLRIRDDGETVVDFVEGEQRLISGGNLRRRKA